ncbi:gamma-glutamylcyclotransferase family protein [Brevibacillus sp. GCM10020057]|uniref:gamma-glutamylcyclotransferase family protein n=1 Tax=Brevibacillus sp. GCM10020057 TaxID=3317327 RepID=UPI00363EC581
MRQPLPVFVYGTLLQGFQNHEWYVKPYAHQAVPAKIRGEIYHLPQGYPGLLAGEDEVVGALLYFAPDAYEKALAGLDKLETYFGPNDPRNEYDRIEVQAVQSGTGEVVRAYVYRYLDEAYVRRQGIRVADGDWRSYMLGERAE